MTKLEKAIYRIFHKCLKIVAKESCLILIDQSTRKLGQSIFKYVSRNRADAGLLEIKNLGLKYPEPSTTTVNIMQQASAILALTSPSLIHSKALKHVCHNGSRMLCISPLSEEAIARSINVDFNFLIEKSRRLSDLFSIGRIIHLTTAAGTDITFPIKRHNGMANTGIVHEPGTFCLLPAGEASVTPDINKSQGIVVVDGSIPGVGLIKNPITLRVKEGYAYKISGKAEAEQLRKILKPFGRKSRNIAEFGIGTNPNAILTGKSIEDEKVLGTTHIALGHHAYEGGSLKGNLHLDAIMKKPSVTIDGHAIMKNGNLVV